MEPRSCPHCDRMCLKDDACNYVICGRTAGGFAVDRNGSPMGCGRAWCYRCRGRLCGTPYARTDAGAWKLVDDNENHDHPRGSAAWDACSGEGYCPGGHDSHKASPTVNAGLPTAVAEAPDPTVAAVADMDTDTDADTGAPDGGLGGLSGLGGPCG